MNKSTKILLPLAVLAVGALIAFLLIRTRPQPQKADRPESLPLVRVVTVDRQPLRMDVPSQGTVEPRTASTLVAQVGGRIVAASPSFTAGGFFRRGETLLSIDPRDYRLAIEQARAQVAQAEVRLERERAEAEVARREWAELGRGEPPSLVAREPQLAEARAAVAAAEAALAAAELNLERTRITAPYDGRVREKRADQGQFVTPGTPVGEIYAVDYAEIRLPVRLDELAFLDLSLSGDPGRGGGGGADNGPPVELTARIAGRPHSWTGRVVGTAGAIDPQTRQLELVARVDRPFSGPVPLAVGLFVDALVEGTTADGAVALPRAALRGEARVMVVEGGDRLRYREVEVLRRIGDQVIVSGGLADGEQVCISPLETPVDGMRVRIVEETPGGAPTVPAVAQAEAAAEEVAAEEMIQ